MRFYFVRHGESLWNVKHLCQGQTDIELSQKGVDEAEAFAAMLARFPIGHICSSPLKRASKTADIIKRHHPHAGYTHHPEFAERNWGPIEGKSSDAMFEIEHLEETNPHYILDPLIESRHNMRQRILKGLDIAFQHHPEPLIVSHGRLFVGLCEALEMPIIRQVKNLFMVEITKTPSGWQMQEVTLLKEGS